MATLAIVTTAVRAALTQTGVKMSEEELLTAIGALDLGQYVAAFGLIDEDELTARLKKKFGELGERHEEALKPVDAVEEAHDRHKETRDEDDEPG